MKWLLIFLVQCYQRLVSPFLRPACRYEPTCSRYMIDAIQERGCLRGVWTGIRRILRCHPWGGCGYDPVAKED